MSEYLDEHRLGVVVSSILLVAVASAVCVGLLHEQCFNALPFEAPESGTPRAGYCDAISPLHPWLVLGLVPTLAVAFISIACRRRPWWVMAGGLLVIALQVVNLIVVNGLEYAKPF